MTNPEIKLRKISELDVAEFVQPTDTMPVVQNGQTLQAPLALFLDDLTAGLNAHLADLANPHQVTKAQVGLSEVDNTSDDDKPISSAQAAALALKADLVAGKIPSSQLPSISLGETFTVGSQAEMLALDAQIGDVAIRTDLSNRKYLLLGTPTVIGDWVAMEASGLPVDSVNGYEGAVVLTKSDVGLSNVDNTSDANKPLSDAAKTALVAVHVAQFGATGVPGQDATAAFNAAIAALPADGGVIDVDPAGQYMITSNIIYNKPILWRGQRGIGDITVNTNGGDAERPLVYWGGTTNSGAIFTQKPAAAGTVLYGGGLEGIVLDGVNAIATGIHLDCNRYGSIEGKGRKFTAQSVLISSQTGTVSLFSKKVRVKDWDYVYGASALAANSHGIRIMGNGSTVPSTQIMIDRCFALIKHGAAVKVEETDNCQFGSLQAFGDNGSGGGGGAGTGCTLWYGNNGSTVAYNNHVTYIAGEIRSESGVFGNTFTHMTAEGGLLKQVSGTPSWHGTIVDASGVNGASRSDAFESFRFPLRSVVTLGPGQLAGLSPTFFLSQWSVGSMPDGVTSSATAVVPVPCWHDGVIESVTLLIGSAAASAGNYRLVMKLSTFTPNTAGLATPEVTVTETVAGPSQNQYKHHTFTMTEHPFTKGDTLFLTIQRLGTDGADSSTTEMALLGVRVRYRSKGPTTYDVGGITAANMPSWNIP